MLQIQAVTSQIQSKTVLADNAKPLITLVGDNPTIEYNTDYDDGSNVFDYGDPTVTVTTSSH